MGGGVLTSEVPGKVFTKWRDGCRLPIYRDRIQGYLTYIRERTLPGPYRRPMPRVLRGSQGVTRFLMNGVPL